MVSITYLFSFTPYNRYDFKLEDLDHSSLPILKIRGGSIIPTSTKEQSAIETIKGNCLSKFN